MLERNYFVEGRTVMLSDIVKNPHENFILYTIEADKNIKRVPGRDLIAELKRHGYTAFSTKYAYIQFNKKSSLNLQRIETKLKEHYLSKYSDIRIEKLNIRPRGELRALPQSFAFGIQEREHLSSSGHCFITTPQKRKIFFAYDIVANVDVYYARTDIEKGSELSNFNLIKKSVMLSRFKADPLQKVEAHALEAKHKLKKDMLLTSRDVRGLYLVKRGDRINITFKSDGIDISFSAKALTSGRAGDTIYVLRNEGNKIKVRVIGKNRAEM